MTAMVSVHNLCKSYGSVVAAAGISFQVQKGEIFGLLGPNGAGKTTALECLEGIRQPDEGDLSIMGLDASLQARRLRNIVGVQLQRGGLPDDMTVDEAMRFFSAYHGAPPRSDLLERLGLAGKLQTQYRHLSTGMQRRLALALAVAHDPLLLILDEPTAGLDVGSRTELHSLMAERRAAGSTIILATHDMSEAEKLADRVAILLRGKIVATGTPRELTATGAGLTRISVRSEDAILIGDPIGLPAVQQRICQDEYVIYFSTDPGQTVVAILAHLKERGDRLIDLRVERPSLEERFVEITAGEDK